MNALSRRTRILIALAAATVLASLAVGYTLLASEPADGGTTNRATVDKSALAAGPRLQVLSNGRLSTVSRNDPAGPRAVSPLQCDRAYAAAGTVACLRPVDPLKATQLVILDSDLRRQRAVPVTGFPNRLRVSASGRMVAWTLFVDGHSYAANGFSTQTGILDTRNGRLIRSLEEFKVTRHGGPYRAADINFWGVTFATDDNRFYATMSTAGHRYLVEGDFAAKSVRTLVDNVECPSLSPDGTRIAFKAAVGGDPHRGWRLSTLDLTTLRITPLAETRSVDDQPAWIDDSTIVYALQRNDGINNIWSLPADGTGAPRLLVPEANSPAP
ncbi:hypothetical protein ABZW18_28580 [Streptomyces sp. NPDC004647]|uniref:TolB family protein n=1 Tax=Streptomyces sp. NPDC004647 TaxID=3154671 RepID=UPI0033B2C427